MSSRHLDSSAANDVRFRRVRQARRVYNREKIWAGGRLEDEARVVAKEMAARRWLPVERRVGSGFWGEGGGW